MGPAGAAEQGEQMTNLPRLLRAGGEPGKLFFAASAIGHNRFLLAKLADPLGAVAVAEAAGSSAAHGGVGDDEIDQTIVDAKRAALHEFGQAPSFRGGARENRSAQAVAGIVGETNRLVGVLDL